MTAPDNTQHALLTGAIRGTVTLDDGTEIDVTPEIVYLPTYAHVEEVSHKISQRYAEEGHPLHAYNDEFVYDEEGSKANFDTVREENPEIN